MPAEKVPPPNPAANRAWSGCVPAPPTGIAASRCCRTAGSRGVFSASFTSDMVGLVGSGRVVRFRRAPGIGGPPSWRWGFLRRLAGLVAGLPRPGGGAALAPAGPLRGLLPRLRRRVARELALAGEPRVERAGLALRADEPGRLVVRAPGRVPDQAAAPAAGLAGGGGLFPRGR